MAALSYAQESGDGPGRRGGRAAGPVPVADRRRVSRPVAGALAEVADEIADVQMYLAALADQLDIDIAGAVSAKMAKNALKYPADRFRGSARKYDDPPEAD